MLMSLPESFKNFCLNYSMSKESYSLAKLLKELQAAEGILGHAKSIQVAEKGSSSFFLQRGTKRRKRLPSQVQAQSRSPRQVTASSKTSASHVVSEVIRKRIALRSKLVLKMVNLQVYLFV